TLGPGGLAPAHLQAPTLLVRDPVALHALDVAEILVGAGLELELDLGDGRRAGQPGVGIQKLDRALARRDLADLEAALAIGLGPLPGQHAQTGARIHATGAHDHDPQAGDRLAVLVADHPPAQGPRALELDRHLCAAGLGQLDLGLPGACVGADPHLVLAGVEPIEPELPLRMSDPLLAAGRADQLDLVL